MCLRVFQEAMKRPVVGIWKCYGCTVIWAGGAYTPHTASAITVRAATRRLRETKEL